VTALLLTSLEQRPTPATRRVRRRWLIERLEPFRKGSNKGNPLCDLHRITTSQETVVSIEKTLVGEYGHVLVSPDPTEKVHSDVRHAKKLKFLQTTTDGDIGGMAEILRS
jgi:hypothetical protein